MPDIIHRLGTTAPITSVYDALATVPGIAGWWTRATTGTSAVGQHITSRFHSPDGAEVGAFVYEVRELEAPHSVRWHIIKGPDEWVGTDIEFRVTQEGEHSIVLFAHRGWREVVPFMAHCSMKWATFLLSLRAYVETGSGRPAPDDLKIDNWN
jgi:uncharacterized protein YndB with AHSA1/START domain